jgi:tyrosinase
MRQANFRYTRREFLTTAAAAAAAAGAVAVPFAPSRAAAKYRRYNVTSPEGQKMLVSYRKGVEVMLGLPADHPQNWFRNAFTHMMDCPHGNWWFYVWHRGYVGYFEQTIRNLSSDSSFAMPYWDWTQDWDPSKPPQIPEDMFDGVLTPTDKAYEPFTGNLEHFTSFITPALMAYWKNLSHAQREQLHIRGYDAFDDLWNDVTTGRGDRENQAFAITSSARYLSRDKPKFDSRTGYNVSPSMIISGLQAEYFNVSSSHSDHGIPLFYSFTSSSAESHHQSPEKSYWSVLESFPHNKVHNYIGGVGSIPKPGPYGNMTNNLSPVDPIFFLHHSNMDRLWDVWTRKQQKKKWPYLPTDQKFFEEAFLFYVNGEGNYVGPRKAGDYLSTDVFNYDYQPGSGEDVVTQAPSAAALAASGAVPPVQGTVSANVGSVPRATIESYLAGTNKRPLMAQITISGMSGREFDVYVEKSFFGTFAFFGMTPGMKMTRGMKMTDVTFAVPLPVETLRQASTGLAARNELKIRVVPSQGQGAPAPVLRQGAPAPVLKAVSVGVL